MNPNVVFYVKLGSGLLAVGIWVGLVLSGKDVTPQEQDIILTAKAYVIGITSHLVTLGAPSSSPSTPPTQGAAP